MIIGSPAAMSKVGDGGVCACVRSFFVHLFNFRWLCDTSSRLDIANKLHVIHGLKASVVIVGSLSYKIVYDQYLTCWVVAAGLTLYYFFNYKLRHNIMPCRCILRSDLPIHSQHPRRLLLFGCLYCSLGFD